MRVRVCVRVQMPPLRRLHKALEKRWKEEQGQGTFDMGRFRLSFYLWTKVQKQQYVLQIAIPGRSQKMIGMPMDMLCKRAGMPERVCDVFACCLPQGASGDSLGTLGIWEAACSSLGNDICHALARLYACICSNALRLARLVCATGRRDVVCDQRR